MAMPEKTVLLDCLEALCKALEHEPSSPTIVQALHQCDRLRQAVQQSHAEGMRFAAFTLNRLMQTTGANWDEATEKAARALRVGLDDAGYGT